jgi:hypothetical protein
VDGREPPSLRPTRNELTDHGARWQKEMRRCGLDPMGGALAYNSVLDQWIATRMRGWLRWDAGRDRRSRRRGDGKAIATDTAHRGVERHPRDRTPPRCPEQQRRLSRRRDAFPADRRSDHGYLALCQWKLESASLVTVDGRVPRLPQSLPVSVAGRRVREFLLLSIRFQQARRPGLFTRSTGSYVPFRHRAEGQPQWRDGSDQFRRPLTARATALSSSTKRTAPDVYLGFSTWHDADRAAGSAWLVGDGAGLRPTVRPAAAAISKRGAFRKDGTRQKGGKRTIRLTRSVGGVRPLYVHHHLPPTGPIAQKAPGSVSQWVCPASSFSD